MIREKIFRILGILLGWSYVALSLVPVYWIAITSIKPRAEVYSYPVTYLPSYINLEPVVNSLTQRPSLAFLRNTVIAALGSTGLVLLVSLPAAYILARLSFKGKETISMYILTTRMFPPATVSIPVFFIIQRFGLLDSLWGLMPLYAAFNLAIATWVLKGYFQQISPEIEESAMIDGCSRFQAFLRVALPLAAPGVAAVMIISTILSWNEFLFALMITNSAFAKTLPVGIAEFIGGAYGILWGEICFLGCLAIAPIIVLTILAQKYIVTGLTLGAVK